MAAATRHRLDRALVDRGLAESRTRAQVLIAGGHVRCDGRVVTKPAALVAGETDLVVTGRDHPWVSRGGLKLAAALDHFAIDPAGAVCIDIGASTGGFTDVLLDRGAAMVHAIDVGHGQLAERLVTDPRVVNRQRTDARQLTAVLVPDVIDIVVCDVGFISIRKAIPEALRLVRRGGRFAGLIKPQFEVGPGKVGKGGVLRDSALRDIVCREISGWLDGLPDWSCDGVIDSPVTGGDGNIEFLLGGTKLC
jgi:23S rRNA (cytidine1920-2'-O)/16S rRNA (cytidine1409-2'-O)-methyltransferase